MIAQWILTNKMSSQKKKKCELSVTEFCEDSVVGTGVSQILVINIHAPYKQFLKTNGV